MNKNFINFFLLTTAALIKGNLIYVERAKNEAIKIWLAYVAATLERIVLGKDILPEPSIVIVNPLPEKLQQIFVIASANLNAVGLFLTTLDADDLGNDDKYGKLLQRLAEILSRIIGQ